MPSYRQEIRIPAAGRTLPADLVIPGKAEAVIIFAHPGANSRANRLNRLVAQHLQQEGFGTLLPDLLSEEELAASREFDISLLTQRLAGVTKWLADRDLFGHYRLGYYATTTAAASALQASVDLEEKVGAIVCRGGRPDLIADTLPEVRSAVLFIVGSLDRHVLQLSREAVESLSCEKKIAVVQGAPHFFGEEYIAEVATLARNWFKSHLVAKPSNHYHTV